MSFFNNGANPTGGAGFGAFANSGGASFFGSSGGSANTGGIFANAPSVSLGATPSSGSQRGAPAGRGAGRGQRGAPNAVSQQAQGTGRGFTSNTITRPQGQAQPGKGRGQAGPAIQGSFQTQTQQQMYGQTQGNRQPQSQGRQTPHQTQQPQHFQPQKQTQGAGGSKTRNVPRSLERGAQNSSSISISSQRDSSMQDESFSRQQPQQQTQPRRQQNQSHSQPPQTARTSQPSPGLGHLTSDVSMQSQRTPQRRDVPAALQRAPSTGPHHQQTQPSVQKGPAQGGQPYPSSRSMTPPPASKPLPVAISTQQQIARQVHPTASKPSSSTQKPPAAKATPSNSGKPLIDEEEDQEDLDDEYDDEYYGEEGEEDYYGEEDFGQEEAQEKTSLVKDSVQLSAPSTSAAGKKNPTPEELQLMQAFKKLKPEAGKLCLFFVTDSCTYSTSCKNKHDQALKDELKVFLQMQRDQAHGSQPKVSQPKLVPQTAVAPTPASTSLPRQQEAAQEKPKKDLRAMLNQERATEAQPQEELKFEEEIKEPIKALPAPKKTLGTLGSKKQLPKQQAPPREHFGTLDSMLSQSKPPSLLRQQSSSALTSVIIKDNIKRYMNYWKKEENFGIPDKAMCLKMCSDEEIYQRQEVEQSSISQFERDENGLNFDVLAIKSYQRSAADTMSTANVVRPPQVLFKTVEYLRDCIVDLDRLQDDRTPYYNERGTRTAPSFQDVYSFLRDRARAIQKDFVVIAKPCCEFKIKSLEQLTRYFISVFHDSFTDPIVINQHVDRINENLTNLISCYQEVRYNYPDERDKFRQTCLQNEAEFRCYQILNFGEDAIQLAKLIKTDELLSIRDPQSKALIKQAIDLASSVDKANTPLFFSRLRREKNYLFCCMMLRFLNKKRKDLVHQLAFSFRKDEGVDLRFAAKMLMFDDIEEASSFIEVCGYTEFKNGRYLIENKISPDNANLAQQFLQWTQESPLSFMDSLRGTRSRCQIMQTSALESLKPHPLDSPPSISFAKIPTTPLFGGKADLTASSIASKSAENQTLSAGDLVRQRQLDALNSKQTDAANPAQLGTDESSKKLEDDQRAKEQEEEAVKKKAEEAAKIAAEKAIKERAEKEKRDREEQERRQQEAAIAAKKAAEELLARKRKQCRDWFELLEFKIKQRKNRFVLKSFREINKDYKPLLTRIMRSNSARSGASDQNQIESEGYFDFVVGQLPTLELQKSVSQSYEDLQFKSKICPKLYGPQNYELPALVNKILKDTVDKGLFKTKLFYHPANTEGSSADNLMYVQEIFDCSDRSKKEDNILYKFEKFEISSKAAQKLGMNIEQKLMQEFMGNNLIVVFSSQKSIQSDLAKVKAALQLCPPFSRFSMLWIFNRQLSAESQKDMQINNGEKLIKDGLLNDLKRETLSSLQVVNTFCTASSGNPSQSAHKKLKSSAIGAKSYSYVDPKNLLLSFILHDLEASIQACHVTPLSKTLPPQVKLSEVLRAVVPDAVDIAEGKDPKAVMRKVINKVVKVISTLEKSKEAAKDKINEEILKGELQVVNLLLQVSQQQTIVIMEAIKQAVQQRVQQGQFSQENHSAIQNSILIYDRLSQFSQITPFSLAKADDREVLMKKVHKILIYHVKDILDHKDLKEVKNCIRDIYQYDSTKANTPDYYTYRGGRLFAALFRPYVTALSSSTATLHPVSPSPLNPTTLLAFLSAAPLEPLTPPQPLPVTPPLPTSSTYTTVSTLGKRSAADKLQEELKHELCESRFGNKRRHVEAQEALGFLKDRQEVNERIVDSPPPSHITRVREAVENAMKGNQDTLKMKVKDHQDNLSKIQAELKAARKRPAKK